MTLATVKPPTAFDVEAIRAQFPALHQQVHGRPLVYLDNAATTLKPQAVIDAVVHAYAVDCANIHRGVHLLSQRATEAYEGAREKVRRFLGAASTREIVFVRGATEAINLVAATFGRQRVGAGDEVLVTGLEHHSNIVPWQMLCESVGAKLVVSPLDDRGDVSLDDLVSRIGERTKLVAVAHVSNALGTVLPVKAIVDAAHARGVPVLVDGAQAAPHLAVDVAELGCDFYALSGHKMYGPTGIGVLYGQEAHLEAMPPYQGGGDMIQSVTFEKTTFNELPYKFEAGTPHIAGGIGLGAAVDWLEDVGLDRVAAHEHDLLEHGTRVLSEIPGLKIVGTSPGKAAVLSFVLEGVHPHDVGTIVDAEGVAIRTGHHCAQPVMERFGIPATSRASLGVYDTQADLDALGAALHKVLEVFG